MTHGGPTLTNTQLRASAVPVSIASLPLPTGGATEATLSSIDAKTEPRQARDAFQRWRISEPFTIFDSKQIKDAQTLFWDDAAVSGSGTSSTYNTNQASTTIAVGATTAGVRARQTRQWFGYQPGKSQLVLITGVIGAATAGITQRIGYFETNNGLFFEMKSTGIGVVRRTYTSGSVVDNRTAQASWNIDKMDGTGVSGITLDFTKTQIFVIDFEWLGVGSVRFGFVVDGIIYYCHQMNHANSLSLVYMSNPNLPVRYEISNDGTGAASSLVCICACVMSEGGQQDSGIARVVDRGITALTTLNNTSLYPLISIRKQTGYEMSNIKPKNLGIMTSTTTSYRWVLLLNPTVAGAAFAFTAVTNSSVEADVVATSATTVTGGTELASGYGFSTNESNFIESLPSRLRLGTAIDGTRDIIVLAVQRITGTTESFYASLGYDETI